MPILLLPVPNSLPSYRNLSVHNTYRERGGREEREGGRGREGGREGEGGREREGGREFNSRAMEHKQTCIRYPHK